VIAELILGAPVEQAPLGEIVLRPHQKEAVGRLTRMLERRCGALLADATGLGKTYVALGVARQYESVVVIAPASLRDSWQSALARTRMNGTFVSLERLSRIGGHAVPADDRALVIVDEAHHLRTPSTKRYAAVAALARRARLLLLSATPVQNRRADVTSQLALFLGTTAWTMSDEEIGAVIVRRVEVGASATLPALNGPHRISLSSEDDVLDELLALPNPVPAADEGLAGALVVYTLVRQWASSRAALLAAVRRRIARGVALIDSLMEGHWPTKRDLGAWVYADGAQQLALPGLLVEHPSNTTERHATLLAAVRAHEAALRALAHRLRDAPNPDLERAARLREIRERHPGARIIAFSQYVETVRALGRLLGSERGIAELTAGGARVAGGPLARREVLAQFAPDSSGSFRSPAASDRIELLLSTDVLSEGLDLQAASVLVHLDLPWNPARLEQRLGRIRRLGSSHRVVTAYVIAPPTASERLLKIESRMRAKLRIAQRVVGVASTSAREDVDEHRRSPIEADAAIRSILERWRCSTIAVRDARRPIVAAVSSPTPGFVALLLERGEPALVADTGDGCGTSSEIVARALESASGELSGALRERVEEAFSRLRRWHALQRGVETIDLRAAAAARTRRRIAARIGAIVAGAPRHRRVAITALAERARVATRLVLGEGAERVLADLGGATQGEDEGWLRAVAAFGEVHARSSEESRGANASPPGNPNVVALIVLQVDRPAAAVALDP
jgi:superfamily II DNA or RNA helicase